LQAQVEEAAGLAIEQRLDAEPLGEAAKLARGRTALLKVDEVHLDAALLEEPKCVPRIGVILRPEDLDLSLACHGRHCSSSWYPATTHRRSPLRGPAT
jgi:hypothetical protein